MPDESTIRKLVRRLGEQPISEISRLVIAKATRETRFRGRALRIDSTVVEADVRYATDAGLALDGACALVRESRATADAARRSARGRGARRKLAAARRVEQVAARAERITTQIRQRVAGERITDRLVSLADPDARPIRKGKLGNPTQFGYVAQLAEVCPASGPGQRGFLMPVSVTIGNPSENELLPETVAELSRAGLAPRIVAVDGGFQTRATSDALEPLAPRQVFIAGRKGSAGRSTRRRLARFRTGCEGRISHLKRAYRLGRSRLRGLAGVNTHTNWAILAYNADTYRHHATA